METRPVAYSLAIGWGLWRWGYNEPARCSVLTVWITLGD